MDEISKANRVKEAHKEMLMAKPNVVGVGVGFKIKNGVQTDQTSIIILVSKKLPRAELSEKDQLPLDVEGIPVDVLEIGQINPGS